MQALALNDQRSEALNQYEICCQALSEDLDVEPDEATKMLYEKIRAGQLKGTEVGQRQSHSSTVFVPRPLTAALPTSGTSSTHAVDRS